MRKFFIFLLVLIISSTASAQKKDQFVGVWQKVSNLAQGSVTISYNGKVFMPDGRVFGYILDPVDFENYEKFDFTPWMFADYGFTSDSTYYEEVKLHNDTAWEGRINFKYRFLNSRTLLAYYDHTNPDGTVQTIIDLWIKAVYDAKEQKNILKKVSDNWDAYVKRAKEMYGRE